MQVSAHTLLSAALCLSLAWGSPAALALNATQDTDGDNIPDMEEDANRNGTIDGGETDPYNADTDNGGESDGSEKTAQRNPLDLTDDMTYDFDGDGLANGIEVLNETDPKKPDTDDDGVHDRQDPFPLDSKFHVDDNVNGLPDEWEKMTRLDAQGSAVQTPTDDPDEDGLTNAEELARGTDPTNSDTDHDGIDDKTESEQGTDPKENACLEYATAEAFTDVAGHWSETYVTKLRGISILPDQTKLVRGYDSVDTNATKPTFSPDRQISRYEFLKMVLLSTCIKLRTSANREQKEFTDIRKVADANENYDGAFRRYVIYTAAHFKIVEGYADPNGDSLGLMFRPDSPVSRAEAVKILSLAAHLNFTESSNSTVSFSDVSGSDWFQPYVALAAERGIVSGYDDGTFKPHNPITRAEAAKIIEVTMRQNPMINGYVLPE